MSPKAFVIITELLFILFMWLLQIQYIEPEVILRNVLGGAPADVMVVQHMMADLGPLLRNTGPQGWELWRYIPYNDRNVSTGRDIAIVFHLLYTLLFRSLGSVRFFFSKKSLVLIKVAFIWSENTVKIVELWEIIAI